MEITFSRKNKRQQWHIYSAGYGSPACCNTPSFAPRENWMHGLIEVDESIEDSRLVVLDMRGERVYDPDDVCGTCKKTLISSLKRLRRLGKI